jgi:alkylation response protein AidB-like acyl-CoA dehydrogenase
MNMASATPTSMLTDAMLKRFADRAPGYDRENRFFEEDFNEMKQAGYLTAAVPRELGEIGRAHV